MGELKGTAEEIKADLTGVAQDSLGSELVPCTGGDFPAPSVIVLLDVARGAVVLGSE